MVFSPPLSLQQVDSHLHLLPCSPPSENTPPAPSPIILPSNKFRLVLLFPETSAPVLQLLPVILPSDRSLCSEAAAASGTVNRKQKKKKGGGGSGDLKRVFFFFFSRTVHKIGIWREKKTKRKSAGSEKISPSRKTIPSYVQVDDERRETCGEERLEGLGWGFNYRLVTMKRFSAITVALQLHTANLFFMSRRLLCLHISSSSQRSFWRRRSCLPSRWSPKINNENLAVKTHADDERIFYIF